MSKLSFVVKMSVWLLFIIGGLWLSLYLDNIFFGGPVAHNTLLYYTLFVIGVILLVTVLNISRNTGRLLARYGHDKNKARGQINLVVKQGPYAFMRHPMHLGLLFFPLAIALISASPSFILIVAPAEMLLIIILIKLVEEPQTKKLLGKEYEKYMKQVPMFCFSLKCIGELLKPVK